MSPPKQPPSDEAVVIALEQVGRTLQLLESLFQRLEQHVHARLCDPDDNPEPQLDNHIPADRTLH